MTRRVVRPQAGQGGATCTPAPPVLLLLPVLIDCLYFCTVAPPPLPALRQEKVDDLYSITMLERIGVGGQSVVYLGKLHGLEVGRGGELSLGLSVGLCLGLHWGARGISRSHSNLFFGRWCVPR